MMRKRVFYVLDSLDDDEVGEHVATLLGRISRARFEPRVVSLTEGGPLGQVLRDMRVTVHSLPGGGRRRDPVLAVPRLRKLLSRLDVDLCHTFHPVAGAVTELAVPRGVPVIRYVPRLPSPSDPALTRLAAALEGLAARRTPVRYVVGHESGRAAVAAYFGLNGAEQVGVVPECLTVSALRAEAADRAGTDPRPGLGLEAEERVVLYLTDYAEDAAVDNALEACALARVEEPSLRFFFVGTGPSEAHARWRAEEHRLGDAVAFVRDLQAMSGLIDVAAAAVDDGLGLAPRRAVLEAAAVGVPVLRTDPQADEGDLSARPVALASNPQRMAAELIRVVTETPVRQAVVGASEELAATVAVTAVAEAWADCYDEVAADTVREG